MMVTCFGGQNFWFFVQGHCASDLDHRLAVDRHACVQRTVLGAEGHIVVEVLDARAMLLSQITRVLARDQAFLDARTRRPVGFASRILLLTCRAVIELALDRRPNQHQVVNLLSLHCCDLSFAFA